MPEAFTAQTPAQARLLLTYGYQVVLGEIMARPSSASAIAQASEVPLKQVHHRLTRLCEAGLVQVVGEQRRGGRPIKLYRARAASFRVPFALTQAEDLQALGAEMWGPYLDAFQQGIAALLRERPDEVRLCLDKHGVVSANYGGIEKTDSAAGAYGSAAQLRLLSSTRLELEARLRDLKRWAQEREAAERNAPEAQDTILGIFIAPGSLK